MQGLYQIMTAPTGIEQFVPYISILAFFAFVYFGWYLGKYKKETKYAKLAQMLEPIAMMGTALALFVLNSFGPALAESFGMLQPVMTLIFQISTAFAIALFGTQIFANFLAAPLTAAVGG